MGHELQKSGAESGLAPMTVSTSSVSGMAIMVAEDDAMQANLVRQRLQREGMVVDVVNNGKDAVANMRDKPYAVYILDVNMPGMSGFEVLQRIRKDPVTTNTPVIMLTAMGSESDILRAYELGTNDYILKPFSAIQLVARVKTLLKFPR
jgi:DNA-binding response OmpR family regulator